MRFALIWLWALADAAYCEAYWQTVVASEWWLSMLMESVDD